MTRNELLTLTLLNHRGLLRALLPSVRDWQGEWCPMDDVHIDEPAVEATANPAHSDRRRPGRSNYAHPALIELLRLPSGKLDAAEASRDREDDLAPTRGIRNGILLSVPLWCAMAAAWLFLGR